MDNADAEIVVVVDGGPLADAYHGTFICAITFLFRFIGGVADLLEHLGVLWTNYYSRIFGEEAAIMLQSPLSFVIISLYAFAEIKSQGSDFPFRTHPRSINVAVTCLLFYGLFFVAGHFISAANLGPTSVYAILAHLGRICCLCILVTYLASLFYL